MKSNTFANPCVHSTGECTDYEYWTQWFDIWFFYFIIWEQKISMFTRFCVTTEGLFEENGGIFKMCIINFILWPYLTSLKVIKSFCLLHFKKSKVVQHVYDLLISVIYSCNLMISPKIILLFYTRNNLKNSSTSDLLYWS